MTCYKCQGFLGKQYDVQLGQWEVYCVNCGARPEVRPAYKDGREASAPPLCRKCKVNPRSMIEAYRSARETEECLECRVKGLRQRRKWDMKRGKKLRNVRHKGALLR